MDSASSSSSTSAVQDVDGKESTDEPSTSALREDEEREIERERERGKSDSDIIRDIKIELKWVEYCVLYFSIMSIFPYLLFCFIFAVLFWFELWK